jgi:hypothetical protein
VNPRTPIRWLLLLCAFASPHEAAAAAEAKPNVVHIMSDDVGWGDLGVRGGGVPTPNIDNSVDHRREFAEVVIFGTFLSNIAVPTAFPAK